MSDVESVGSVVENGDVEGDDVDDDGGQARRASRALGNVECWRAHVGVEAREGEGRRRREEGGIVNVEKDLRIDACSASVPRER